MSYASRGLDLAPVARLPKRRYWLTVALSAEEDKGDVMERVKADFEAHGWDVTTIGIYDRKPNAS